jgi:hypothetical protein
MSDNRTVRQEIEAIFARDKKTSPRAKVTVDTGDPNNPKERYEINPMGQGLPDAWRDEQRAQMARSVGGRYPGPTSAAKSPKYRGNIYQGKR